MKLLADKAVIAECCAGEGQKRKAVDASSELRS